MLPRGPSQPHPRGSTQNTAVAPLDAAPPSRFESAESSENVPPDGSKSQDDVDMTPVFGSPLSPSRRRPKRPIDFIYEQGIDFGDFVEKAPKRSKGALSEVDAAFAAAGFTPQVGLPQPCAFPVELWDQIIALLAKDRYVTHDNFHLINPGYFWPVPCAEHRALRATCRYLEAVCDPYFWRCILARRPQGTRNGTRFRVQTLVRFIEQKPHIAKFIKAFYLNFGYKSYTMKALHELRRQLEILMPMLPCLEMLEHPQDTLCPRQTEFEVWYDVFTNIKTLQVPGPKREHFTVWHQARDGHIHRYAEDTVRLMASMGISEQIFVRKPSIPAIYAIMGSSKHLRSLSVPLAFLKQIPPRLMPNLKKLMVPFPTIFKNWNEAVGPYRKQIEHLELGCSKRFNPFSPYHRLSRTELINMPNLKVLKPLVGLVHPVDDYKPRPLTRCIGMFRWKVDHIVLSGPHGLRFLENGLLHRGALWPFTDGLWPKAVTLEHYPDHYENLRGTSERYGQKPGLPPLKVRLQAVETELARHGCELFIMEPSAAAKKLL